MKITKELLESKRACSDGTKAFNRFFPNGFDLAQWTPEVQLRIIKQTRLSRYIGWAYENALIPLWSMTSADLRWANLTSADLRSADLTSAYYSKYTVLPENFDAKSAGILWVEV